MQKNSFRYPTSSSRVQYCTSGQDGGVGRYAWFPHTTKRRTTTDLKTKNNQNCQKIELYRSSTTMELKKKYSSRLVGGAETGSQGGEDAWQGGGWQTTQTRILMWINLEEQLGNKTDSITQGYSVGKIKPPNL